MTKKAKVYGSSLYDLAAEENLTEKIYKDLKAISSALKQIPGYSKLLSSPAISKEERKKLIEQAWKENIHRYSLNFLYLLVDNNLMAEFENCSLEYEERYNKEHGILPVTAVCAIEPSKESLEKLSAAILKKTGKTPKITVKIDESLIGGMRLEMEGSSYDSSISYHMDALHRLLQENI